VPLTPTYDCDAEMMCASASAITYICSPNNPTGTAVARRSVEELARRATGLVIIDEAYAEFADENLLDLARDRDNVLVVRTFSKAFGLAGVRVGYGVGAPALVREVEKARGPFKVSAVAMDAAVAALADDAWMRQHVALARENRDRLTHELRARSIDAIPSQANFVLAPLPDATRVARLMRQHGVAVRAFNGLPPIAPELARAGGETLRISVGPWAELETALAALDRARGMLA
jgi:histidinol-phosphate aminotransferase